VSAVFLARGVGKRYAAQRSSSIRALLSRGTKPEGKWVLRGVDAEVAPGEVLGVIGRNGAGKSTLLKIAAGVTAPTEGSVQRPGRIAPLIEVGAGFHQELTGRENIYVNGRLLGLGAREIAARFEEIVEFSGLSEMIDESVRSYSSGMYMRLGFSVAIHTDPELLIVDEVLAVGDLPFQAKCLDRIRELREGGAGVLFVSHNLTAVLNLADRALLLERGDVRAAGDPYDVVGAYHDLLATAPRVGPLGEDAPPSGELRFGDVRVLDEDGNEPMLFRPGQRARLEIDLTATTDTPEGLVGIRIVKEGTGLVAGWRADDGPYVPPLRAGEQVTLVFGLDLNLAEGGYSVEAAIARRDWSALMEHRHRVAHLGIASRPGTAGVTDVAPSLTILTR
jgi:ABC-type polysaccharide/polyol phosphate transport system ATPase subunit